MPAGAQGHPLTFAVPHRRHVLRCVHVLRAEQARQILRRRAWVQEQPRLMWDGLVNLWFHSQSLLDLVPTRQRCGFLPPQAGTHTSYMPVGSGAGAVGGCGSAGAALGPSSGVGREASTHLRALSTPASRRGWTPFGSATVSPPRSPWARCSMAF